MGTRANQVHRIILPLNVGSIPLSSTHFGSLAANPGGTTNHQLTDSCFIFLFLAVSLLPPRNDLQVFQTRLQAFLERSNTVKVRTIGQPFICEDNNMKNKAYNQKTTHDFARKQKLAPNNFVCIACEFPSLTKGLVFRSGVVVVVPLRRR